MEISAEIFTPIEDSEDSEQREGSLEIETVGNEEIFIHVKVNGDFVASAMLDRFMAGLLAGTLYGAADEAVAQA